MTHTNTYTPQDDLTRQATAHHTGWIQVQRRYESPAANNPWPAQLPPTQEVSAPATAQQPIDPRDIFGFVQQHGRNEPWDGIALVQASQQTTTANWYNPQQYEYQHQFHDHQYRPYGHGDVAYQQGQGDNNSNNNTHHHGQDAHSASSTHAQHGSQERQERQQGHASSRRDEHPHRRRRSQRRA